MATLFSPAFNRTSSPSPAPQGTNGAEIRDALQQGPTDAGEYATDRANLGSGATGVTGTPI